MRDARLRLLMPVHDASVRCANAMARVARCADAQCKTRGCSRAHAPCATQHVPRIIAMRYARCATRDAPLAMRNAQFADAPLAMRNAQFADARKKTRCDGQGAESRDSSMREVMIRAGARTAARCRTR